MSRNLYPSFMMAPVNKELLNDEDQKFIDLNWTSTAKNCRLKAFSFGLCLSMVSTECGWIGRTGSHSTP